MGGEDPRSQKISYSHGTGQPPLLGATIGAVFDATAREYADQPALIVRHQQRRYTYRELAAEVGLLARGLLSLAVQPGERVGIWATNWAEWVITQFATAKIGAILVNINPAYRAAELEYALKQSQCRTLLLIHGFRNCDYVSTLTSISPEVGKDPPGALRSQNLPDLRDVIFIGEQAPPGMFHWSEVMARGETVGEEDLFRRQDALDFDDPINIQYTSGTTGFPKGAVLSHHNIVNNARFLGAVLKITHDDKICIPVPFYHCFGMVIGNMLAACYGATMVIPAESFDPLATLSAVEEERCTALYGVPTMFIAELEHPEFARFDLRSLRTGIMAGSPCPVEVMKRVVEQMHCREITIAYGLTETSPALTQTTTDDPIELRVSTVGRPLPHTEIKIVEPGTGRTVPLGAQGELCARGYMVMKGYYNNPQATRQAIDADGWLHSGDLATMSENGYCRITGRLKDMIIRGGENIYPREIEEFLYTCPEIIDVQVFSVPDRKYGEQVAAWVKLKEGATLSPEDIRSFCQARIAAYKVPRYVKVVESFPMTVTGKIQKFKMREIYTRELGLEAAAKIETA